VRKEMFGDHRPASTLVEVAHLVDPEARLEVEAVAFLA
jgi:enamine deaminase RidA (YjgF/YER057c/UK114 family)